MGTTQSTLREQEPRRKLRAAIAVWRNNVIDLDAVVDDSRQAVDRAVDALRGTVRERDRAAVHLAHLLALYDEVDAVAAPFRFAIADTFALQQADV